MNRRSLLLVPLAAGCATPQPAAPRDWFIFLETGRPTPPDPAEVMRMQRGHIENFKRLFDAGRLFAAGPMRDPARVKRGIVVVRAASMDELRGYFEADDYVRLGHMTLNAVPATANRALATEGIDPSGVEEVRIAMIARGPAGERGRALLSELTAQGRFGAWYTLHAGPIADVLFTRSTDDAAIASMLAPHGGDVTVWTQWLGKGCRPLKRLATAPNLALATLWADMLSGAGLQTTVQRAFASGIAGHVPPDQALPELWVEDEGDLERARALLHEIQHPLARRWACRGCGEVIDGPFLQCWRCGAEAAP